jgi:hypothetical protein
MWEIVPLFGIFFGTVSTLAIVWIIGRTRQKRFEVQAQVQTKLIERFGSAPELIDFLHSPAGREFVTGVQSAPAILTRERVISGVSRAIILVFVGLCFIGMYWALGDDDIRGLLVTASIFIFLGVGFLVASIVSFQLSKRFGFVEPYAPYASRTTETKES